MCPEVIFSLKLTPSSRGRSEEWAGPGRARGAAWEPSAPSAGGPGGRALAVCGDVRCPCPVQSAFTCWTLINEAKQVARHQRTCVPFKDFTSFSVALAVELKRFLRARGAPVLQGLRGRRAQSV